MGFSVGRSINLLIVRLERGKLKIYLGRFPFVTTDRPDHSRRNNNFPFNQNSPARSVKL